MVRVGHQDYWHHGPQEGGSSMMSIDVLSLYCMRSKTLSRAGWAFDSLNVLTVGAARCPALTASARRNRLCRHRLSLPSFSPFNLVVSLRIPLQHSMRAPAGMAVVNRALAQAPMSRPFGLPSHTPARSACVMPRSVPLWTMPVAPTHWSLHR